MTSKFSRSSAFSIFSASSVLAALCLAGTGTAQAQVSVKDAWVRATVPQQKATGAFMQLSAASDSRLVAVSSSAVPLVELHEMTMDRQVMKMRQIAALDLPAGQSVALKPGGHHLMLMNLKTQLKPGDSVPLSLVFEDRAGKRQTVELKAEVRALSAAVAGPASTPPAHGEHKH